jgi:hypothetical protein
VAANESAAALTVTARSKQDTTKSDSATVTVRAGGGDGNGSKPGVPVVTGVKVSPATPSVAKGTAQQFSAEVQGTGSPDQAVTWSIEEANKHEGTAISDTGLLTVDAVETLSALSIKAASAANTGVSGTAAVTVTGGSGKPPTTTVPALTLNVRQSGNSSSSSGRYFSFTVAQSGWKYIYTDVAPLTDMEIQLIDSYGHLVNNSFGAGLSCNLQPGIYLKSLMKKKQTQVLKLSLKQN